MGPRGTSSTLQEAARTPAHLTHEGVSPPRASCADALCLCGAKAGSGTVPGPIKPARGIKVSRMQLCLLDLTRPEGRFL